MCKVAFQFLSLFTSNKSRHNSPFVKIARCGDMQIEVAVRHVNVDFENHVTSFRRNRGRDQTFSLRRISIRTLFR